MRRTRSIGLVVTDIENPFFGSVTRFVDEFVLAGGCTLVLSVSDDNELELGGRRSFRISSESASRA